MRFHAGEAITALILAAGALSAVPAAAAPSCGALAQLALPQTKITSAATVVGTFTPPDGGKAIADLPAFCRVAATLTPSPVSDIKIEIWLPLNGWNGRLEGVGNGGLAGVISYGAMAPALKGGYVTVSTDTGHVASDTTWLPVAEKERDYGSRAIHGMTVAAQAVIKQFYGSPVKHSYFNGCSTGGGQAFGEAQLYPADYDGILAGAPQDFPTHLRSALVWESRVVHDPAGAIPDKLLPLITKAVLTQCGGEVGLDEGFLSNPQQCHFDPAAMLCKPGEAPETCLTGPQIETVKQLYAGLRNPHTHELIWPGVAPGSESPASTAHTGLLGWHSTFAGPALFSTAEQFFKYAVFQNPDLDFASMNFDTDVARADHMYGAILDHIQTDLGRFTGHGGKLLIYHGWDDPAISPRNTINYFESVVATVQKKRGLADATAALRETEQSVRLFMVPGMGHCTGGPGPDHFDGIGKLAAWVEQGTAPDQIKASHIVDGKTAYSRPLCPYPQVTTYKGTGDRAAESSYDCVEGGVSTDPDYYPKALATIGR